MTAEIFVPSKQDIDYLRCVPTGFVYDSLGNLGVGGAMTGIHPVFPLGNRHIAGPARTVRFLPQRGVGKSGPSMYEVIYSCRPGDIIVVDGRGFAGHFMGDNMATYGKVRGVEAFVIDGGARDAEGIQAIGMPVFCRAACVVRGLREFIIVDTDIPIDCGGAQVCPGDVLLGDSDGIAVIPAEVFPKVLAHVKEIEGFEKEQEDVIRANGKPEAIHAVIAKKHPKH